jgi:hypothetical protein
MSAGAGAGASSSAEDEGLYDLAVPDHENTLGGIKDDTQPDHPSVIGHLGKSLSAGAAGVSAAQPEGAGRACRRNFYTPADRPVAEGGTSEMPRSMYQAKRAAQSFAEGFG